jgi:DNA-directed RNA polymerase subunit A'
MQRRLINALEDLKVMEDNTVRNTAQVILQFKYGEDGIDPTRSAHGDPLDLDDILNSVLGFSEIPEEDIEPWKGYGELEKELPEEEPEEIDDDMI